MNSLVRPCPKNASHFFKGFTLISEDSKLGRSEYPVNNGLFLPLEVVKREYFGKLCLAAEMAVRGMPVFIGHKRPIIDLALNATEPGVLFYKDAAKDEPFASKLIEKGFGFVAQDEEAGIIYSDYGEFYANRNSLDNIPNINRFFCWGQDDYDFLTNKFCKEDVCNIVNTGSVKTVFWGPYGAEYFASDIEKIRTRYSRFVLFVTNFGVGNSYLSEKDLIRIGEKYNSNISETYKEIYDKDVRLMRLVIESASKITIETDFNVVIRPHPTENVEKWRQISKHLNKVSIEHEGDLSPWLLASDCVLHNSCTSGIQAAASNLPVVAFGVSQNDLDGVRSVPNDVSMSALNVEDILNIVRNLKECWGNENSKRHWLLERKLKNTGTLKPLLDTASTIIELAGDPNNSGNKNLGSDSFLYDVKEIYRTSNLRRNSMKKIRDQGKRPSIRKSDLVNDVNRFLKLFSYNVDLDIRRIAPNSFCIRRAC